MAYKLGYMCQAYNSALNVSLDNYSYQCKNGKYIDIIVTPYNFYDYISME